MPVIVHLGGIPTPGAPTLTAPINGATSVSLTPTLQWLQGLNATSYDVALGSTNPPPFVTNTTALSFTSGTLLGSTQYFWNVTSKNTTASTASPTFSFTTMASGSAPLPPNLTAPANGATGVSVLPTLQWSASTGATSYDVAFGTSNPPPFVTNTTLTTYSPSALAVGTTYFWNITAKNSNGTGVSATWSFTTAVGGGGGSVLVYNSPSCKPNTSYAAGTPSAGFSWACGSYPSTTPPAISAAGCPAGTNTQNACTPGFSTTMQDPDTHNKILRVTMVGSLNNQTPFTSGNQFYPPNSGWIKVWASDSSKFLVIGDSERFWWVGFNPTNMSLTGASGILPAGVATWNFSSTDPDIVYGLHGTNVAQYKISTGTLTDLQNLNSIPGYVSGQNWLALYLGGTEVCAYSGTNSQGTGRLVACYNVVSGVSHMIDVGQAQATMDGVVIPGINVGSLNGLHSLVVGQNGRYVFVDTGQVLGTACSTNTPPKNAQFLMDLQTGSGSQLGWYCDQTHIAVGYAGVIYQSAGNMGAMTNACPFSSLGEGYRTFTNMNPAVLTSGCFPGSSNSTHFSWANNFNDANADKYPVLADNWNPNSGGATNCIGCGELMGFQSVTTQTSATIYRFGQTWKTPGLGDYIARSSQISYDGKWALFGSDWKGNTGLSGHRDIFVMQLQ